MKKTGEQVVSDILELINESSFAKGVSGDVYRDGLRPRDSQAEDIVITFVTGFSDQMQEGTVVINAFVRDIDPYSNGVFVANKRRTLELEILAQEWVESLTTDRSEYWFRQSQTIYTEKEAELKQHFVSVRLNYRILDIPDIIERIKVLGYKERPLLFGESKIIEINN